jgi:hypothetical protein
VCKVLRVHKDHKVFQAQLDHRDRRDHKVLQVHKDHKVLKEQQAILVRRVRKVLSVRRVHRDRKVHLVHKVLVLQFLVQLLQLEIFLVAQVMVMLIL